MEEIGAVHGGRRLVVGQQLAQEPLAGPGPAAGPGEQERPASDQTDGTDRGTFVQFGRALEVGEQIGHAVPGRGQLVVRQRPRPGGDLGEVLALQGRTAAVGVDQDDRLAGAPREPVLAGQVGQR